MRVLFLILSLAGAAFAQTPGGSVIGAVSALHADSSAIEVRPDNGAAVTVKYSAATTTQRITPGQTDLSKAESIKIGDIAVGDRVLVTTGAAAADPARRIIVISANDLARRNATDRADWAQRGVSGVVTAVKGNEITLEARSLNGAAHFTVTANDKTSFKRYAPDSVKYSDAKTSSLSEVANGDQFRARGQKSADGLSVVAEDVIFGTFLSKAGTITAVNPDAHEVTVKDLSNNKPLVIRFMADSAVKRMPANVAGAGRGPAPAPNAATGGAAVNRPPDIGQILESLPALKPEELKPGETIVVSAIKSDRADQVTAVTLLANAEALVQLAMAARGAGASGPAPSLAGLASSISSVGP